MKLTTKLGLGTSVLFSANLLAQTGGFKVEVFDQLGQPLTNTLVTLSSSESLIRKRGTTDAHGHVHFSGLAPSQQYQIALSKEGFKGIEVNSLPVYSGRKYTLSYQLKPAESELETIEILGNRALTHIDLSSSTVESAILLDLTESIPTGRSYQSYLQLVPGVKPSANGNPSSKSGVNYRDFGGEFGSSSDNIYLLDGINVTDNQNGGFGANINSEIIQEMRVITGGLPAEFEGGTGLVSQVTTKSGSNEFHGSVNYYFQNDNLVGSHDNLTGNEFSSFDMAFTFGGPIIKDTLWFFSSLQKKQTDTSIVQPETLSKLRKVEDKSTMSFVKLTWLPVKDGLMSFSFFDDPATITGSTEPFVLNNRDQVQKNGGDNYKLEYNHNWQNASVNLTYASHTSEYSRFAQNKTPLNDIAYQPSANLALSDTYLGGRGSDLKQFRKRKDLQLSVSYFLDTDQFGYHSIKFGTQHTTNNNNINEHFHGNASYSSLATDYAGLSLDEFTDASWVGRVNLSKSDYLSIINAMQTSDDAMRYLTWFDRDRNGSISAVELGQHLRFNSDKNNPNQALNLFRTYEEVANPINLKVTGKSVYLQDNIEWDRLFINIGLRSEQWQHHNSQGQTVATFGWDHAHRFNISYDLFGDGNTKVWYFNGVYNDPVRTNMTYFVGNVSGSKFADQIYVNDHWLTYRYRGGSQTAAAMFAPNFKTPYTKEQLLGFSSAIDNDMSIELTYTDRKTNNLVEDISVRLYSQLPSDSPFYRSREAFGLTTEHTPNFVMANLIGGYRTYQGFEAIFHKHKTDNWQFSASYTYGDAEGNSNSDGSVDFQGDFIWLDPRSPNQFGKQPGSIVHLVKAYGTYTFDNGVELGLVYNWNSGTRYSKTWQFAGRQLPVLGPESYEFASVTGQWIAPNSVGAFTSPSYGILDLRVKYQNTCGALECEFFLDVFNLLDHQAITKEQTLAAGNGKYKFGDAIDWVQPRRLYLGARVSF